MKVHYAPYFNWAPHGYYYILVVFAFKRVSVMSLTEWQYYLLELCYQSLAVLWDG